MNYIGSKRRLLAQIAELLKVEMGPLSGTVLDAFAGTGVVSQWFKSTGCRVIANDWQHYSALVTQQGLCWDEWPTFSKLAEGLSVTPSRATDIIPFSYISQPMTDLPSSLIKVLSYLLNLKGTRGEFYEQYCEGGHGGRLYFSAENGQKIQAIRDKIETWQGGDLISLSEANWLTAALLESADRVGNTAAVYGSFLKAIKVTAAVPFRLYVQAPTVSLVVSAGKVACESAELFIRNNRGQGDVSLIYADPPYNGRQYASNYHVLETIARWDLGSWQPRGKTGLRPSELNRSHFCMPKTVRSAFQSIFDAAAPVPLLLSYNNEGLMTETAIRDLAARYYKTCQFLKLPYARFQSDTASEKRTIRKNGVEEFLILCK